MESWPHCCRSEMICRQNEQFRTSTTPGIVLDSHLDFSQVATEIVLCIIVKSLAKIETITMPSLSLKNRSNDEDRRNTTDHCRGCSAHLRGILLYEPQESRGYWCNSNQQNRKPYAPCSSYSGHRCPSRRRRPVLFWGQTGPLTTCDFFGI